MRELTTRRGVLAGSILAAPLVLSNKLRAATEADAATRLGDLERRIGGRLGVAVLNTATGHRFARRADERFPICSTFKFLAAACVLARVDRHEERLDRRITFAEGDLKPWSPVTKDHVGAAGLTVAELCDTAVTLSDNTAGNLLLESFGGPAGLTAYARSLGDGVTRLDRFETELGEARPGDPRDTTTPAAMLENLRRTVLGDALSGPSRERLTAWLIGNKVGDKRLRAGLPKDWRVADKTGTGDNGATNDIAVVWPPGRAPIIISAYFAESSALDDERNAVLAEVGRIVAASA